MRDSFIHKVINRQIVIIYLLERLLYSSTAALVDSRTHKEDAPSLFICSLQSIRTNIVRTLHNFQEKCEKCLYAFDINLQYVCARHPLTS